MAKRMRTVHGMFLPRAFFVTSGEGVSTESHLNAFDDALSEAGIDECNLVYVSSIIPADAIEIKQTRITPGSITFAVVARMDGDEGEVIGAGIGYTKCRGRKGSSYGFIAENHGYKDEDTITSELFKRMKRMATDRNMNLVDPKVLVKSMRVPKDRYGCVVVACVYVPFTAEIGERIQAAGH